MEEATPLADSSDETKETAVETIEDEDAPLAAAEDNCIIHWLILLLTLIAAGYTIIRVVLVNRNEQEEEKQQEA